MPNRSCPICGKTDTKVIRRIDMKIPEDYHLPQNYDVVVCESCGFVYADTSASMEDYDWDYTHCNFYGDDSKDDNTYRYEMVQEFLEQYCRKDSVMLDIGTGNGKFEVALQKNGYTNMVGMDPSGESVDRLHKNGIEAYTGSIYSEVLPEEENKYDCIFLFEVAEHLLCPGKGIQNVRKLLKEAGYFIVSVPDYSQIAEDTSDIPNYFNLEHINYFSEISLDNLMRIHGMRRVAQKRVGIDLIHCYQCINVEEQLLVDEITEIAVQTYFSAKQGKEERVRKIITELKEQQKEIVIWGTGSYLMNLIATTDLLECKIQGFVDNNKIKHGREMYGYTIYPPNYLLDKNDTVLICSMLNGQEIKRQLDEMNTENEIVVL